MPANLKVDFLRGSDVFALSRGRVIVTMLANHPYKEGPLPPGVFSPEQLGEITNKLQSACDEAQCRDINKLKYRNQIRLEFNDAFRNVARHLEIFANGDPAKLENTGYELRKPSKKGPKVYGPLPSPTLSVKHGSLPQTMIAQITALSGAAIYLLQITSTDPGVEENWTNYGLFVHPSRIEIVGLTAGQKYWFRACGIGVSGNGAWSAPFPLMSL